MRPHAHLEKSGLRAAALARRQALDLSTRQAVAQVIASYADALSISSRSVVSGYMPIRGELDPRPLMKALAARGASLAMPTIAADGQPLIFRSWQEDDATSKGPLGISEPLGTAPIVIPNIMLVPLAAFDRRGHRIGYGAGHFDRTLATLRLQNPVLAIGVAYATQEIEAVPDEPHDVPLDLVLTEAEIINPKGT